MDLRKFLAIAFKDVHQVFTDRAGLMIIIAAPLAITFLIAAAFGGVSSGDSPVKGIRVVVVNGDKGAMLGPQQVNFGQNVAEALGKVGDLLTVEVLTDEAEARTRVIEGKARAAVLIPADFSQSLNPTDPSFGDSKVRLTLFRDAGSPLTADIVTAVVRQILNGFTNANVAIYAAGKVNTNPLFLITQAGAIAQDVGSKSGSSADAPISVTMEDLRGTTQQSRMPNLLQYFAPGLAIFFLNFLMASGAISIMEERDNWTLQRLLTTPTKRLTILAGKLGGTYVSGVLQLAALIVATTLIAPILGSKEPVWGTNPLALVLVTLVVVAGSIGFGTLIAGLARNRQQANIYSNAILILAGILGGTFFAAGDGNPPMGILSQLTVNYWATNAYSKLAQANDLLAIVPNLTVLLGMFVVCFGIGVVLFSRRLDV